MNDKIQKRKEDIVYQDLTPSNQIKPEEESIQALRWAIENPNVKNIALSGPYGSGKSSVIQSYLKEYDVPKRYSKWYMKWYYQGVGTFYTEIIRTCTSNFIGNFWREEFE